MADLPPPTVPGPRQFTTTRWSLVVAAGDTRDSEGRDALASLCQIYWPPVYSYIRRRGHSADQAADLTQAFFTYLLEKRSVRAADRDRGRFRSFLLASVNNFLVNEWDRTQALKRGAGATPVSLDAERAEGRYRIDPVDHETPDRTFERRWAYALLEQVVQRLGEEMEASGQGKRFARLRPLLVGEEAGPYRQLADELGMTESSVKVAVHRMRKRFGAILREEVAGTVSRSDEIDAEIRHLFAALESR